MKGRLKTFLLLVERISAKKVLLCRKLCLKNGFFLQTSHSLFTMVNQIFSSTKESDLCFVSEKPVGQVRATPGASLR